MEPIAARFAPCSSSSMPTENTAPASAAPPPRCPGRSMSSGPAAGAPAARPWWPRVSIGRLKLKAAAPVVGTAPAPRARAGPRRRSTAHAPPPFVRQRQVHHRTRRAIDHRSSPEAAALRRIAWCSRGVEAPSTDFRSVPSAISSSAAEAAASSASASTSPGSSASRRAAAPAQRLAPGPGLLQRHLGPLLGLCLAIAAGSSISLSAGGAARLPRLHHRKRDNRGRLHVGELHGGGQLRFLRPCHRIERRLGLPPRPGRPRRPVTWRIVAA